MTLFAKKMEKYAVSSGKRKEDKDGLFKYDYEGFVDVSKRVMQGRSRSQQQEVVREVLLSMLPPGAPTQVIMYDPLNYVHFSFMVVVKYNAFIITGVKLCVYELSKSSGVQY